MIYINLQCILFAWLGKTTSATPRLVIKDRELWKMAIPKIVKNSWFCSACKYLLLCLFLFSVYDDIYVLTYTLLMQLGMAIAIAQHKNFYIGWDPISTIDMGIGVLISM